MVNPTKGNLIMLKNSLELAKVGFELMDRKRNILIREMMRLIDSAKETQAQINKAFAAAYAALQNANITTGSLENIAGAVPVDDCITVLQKSVMGVELPTVRYTQRQSRPYYGLYYTNSAVDDAHACFLKVKELCARLAEIESGASRLAVTIRQTQKRANALKNIIIPGYMRDIHYITEFLEEKEREEFIRLKVIKKQKNSA